MVKVVSVNAPDHHPNFMTDVFNHPVDDIKIRELDLRLFSAPALVSGKKKFS